MKLTGTRRKPYLHKVLCEGNWWIARHGNSAVLTKHNGKVVYQIHFTSAEMQAIVSEFNDLLAKAS